MRKLLILFLLLIIIPPAYAGTPGSGCQVNNIVYTEYLGMASPYDVNQAPRKYYRSNGATIGIHNNSNNPIYICGMINFWPDTHTQVNGVETFVPGVNEFTGGNAQANDCFIGPGLTSYPTGNGGYVTYELDCNRGTTNVPLDDYVWVALLGLGIFGYFTIKKTGLNIV